MLVFTENSYSVAAPSAVCSKDYIACLNGECVPVLWRCDGEKDCADGSDELNCNLTLCDPKDHYRCDTGRCIPISWVCDGAEDCHDRSDEKNCSKLIFWHYGFSMVLNVKTNRLLILDCECCMLTS